MTTFALYPIDQVRPHPRNVRRDAVASDEMVESIRSAGILEPVILGPEVTADDGATVRYLIAGNVRHDGALKADLTVLPAVLRDDLATEAQQVEAMLVENLHRTDLTAVEEAEAYEQLQLFGMDEAAIAAATGRSKTTVHSRLRLVGLPEKARERLHAGDATLGDAEALLEFDDDHEVQAQLEAALGTSDFKWKVQQARDQRSRLARNAQAAADFEDQGLKQVDTDGTNLARPTQFWTRDLQTADAHRDAGCLGFVVYAAESYMAPTLVCTDKASHDAAETATREARNTVPVDPEWQARREQAAREAAEQAAAAKVRVDHIVTALAVAVPSKGKQGTALVAAARALLPVTLANPSLLDVVDDDALDHALGLDTDVEYQVRGKQREELAATLASDAKDGAVLTALVGLLAALAEQALTSVTRHGSFVDGPVSDVAMSQNAWKWLTSTGYAPTEADEKVIARLTELAAGDDTDDGDD